MRYEPRRPARHDILRVRGLDCRVLRWGRDSGNPVLLLHGWADSADSFQFMADEWPPDWPLAAVDWRGFGHSAWSAGGYWFPDYHADLDQLLDILCPAGAARLVGHSMGGYVAMSYAGIRPTRVRAVVNIEGFGLAPSNPCEAPARLGKWLDELRSPPAFDDYADSDDLARRLMRRNPRLTPERASFVADRWTKPLPGGGARLRADPAHRLVNPYLYRRDEMEACWRQVTAPVLLVAGEVSEFASRSRADGGVSALEACIRKLRIEVLAGAGHMLHHEQPGAVVRLIEDFFSET